MSEEHPKDLEPGWTELQVAFRERYLETMNATQSAKDAGYADSTSESHAPMWVGKSRVACPEGMRHVWDWVKQAIANRSRDAEIDAVFVLTRLAEIVDADPTDIIEQDTGAYKPVHDWPIVWRRMLSAADVQELYQGHGEDREKVGEIVKFRFIERLKAYELLGKHVNVSAFRDQIGIGDPNGKPLASSLDMSKLSTEAIKELLAARESVDSE